MGNFSRDTFRLTNVMYQLVSGVAVTEPRHYTGVRYQQGVPVLDADLNELEDIRRHEMELVLRDLIGNGVPGLGSGFAIAPLEQDNDFAIQPGLLVLDGWQVINPARIAYSQLPRFFDDTGTFLGIDLEEPEANRVDLIYLDVWEVETGAADGDIRLVNENIGIETAVRMERQWTVWVAQGETDFEALTLNEAGHKYYPLARLFRNASSRIEPYMIEDQRRLGLTLSEGIKAPMFLQRGTEIVDPVRFSTMLVELRRVLSFWQQNTLFPIVISTMEILVSYQNVFNHIYTLTSSAEVNSDTFNLDNRDGLTVLEKLVQAQNAMLDVIRTYSSGGSADIAILDRYLAYLEGDAASGINGIQPALDQRDLLGAVQGQEALTAYLDLNTGELPEGNVSVTLDRVDLPSGITVITPGEPITITYTVSSDLLVPTTPEVFDLQAEVSDARWASSLSLTQIILGPGESGEVQMTVTPAAGLTAGEFANINLVARAHRRPGLKSVQLPQRFIIDELPPGETFFFYSGSVELDGNVLHIPRAQIDGNTYEIDFTLRNTSGGTETHVFEINYELVWPGATPSGWIPATPMSLTETVAGVTQDCPIPVLASNLPNSTDDISFTLQITATLVQINGTPISGGKDNPILLPIMVDMSE